MRRLLVTITGRVQGVSFRAWTQAQARALGLRGWVRNTADGGVEAFLAGDPQAIADMLDRLEQGPRAARVNRVAAVSAPEADDIPEDFVIRG